MGGGGDTAWEGESWLPCLCSKQKPFGPDPRMQSILFDYLNGIISAHCALLSNTNRIKIQIPAPKKLTI